MTQYLLHDVDWHLIDDGDWVPKVCRKTCVLAGDRIAEVLVEARGERVMTRSLHLNGVERRSAVK